MKCTEHLKRRNNRQTIMLGFSDGTKDGGYLMGNWSIYKTKKNLRQFQKNMALVLFSLMAVAAHRQEAVVKLINFTLPWVKIFPIKKYS